MVYSASGNENFRFRGRSWREWTLEVDDGGHGEFRLIDRVRPRAGDGQAGTRAPSYFLNPGWLELSGLRERIPVEASEFPEGRALLTRLELDADEVWFYVSPSAVGCQGSLRKCVGAGEAGARGVVHVATGFPLLVEEAYDGFFARHLEAQSFAHGR